jgi:SAM-dependent methyltransferase
VIECGCGPIGGLAILAEMVGPAGRVVGVDFSEPAIQYARSVMVALGLENVELVAGDIHELDAATLGGPFDLAFTRAFLMHQADPVRGPPPPRSLPYLGALETYWDLLHEVMERAGVPRGTVERLPRSAREAGLEIAGADGFFATQDPATGFEIHAGSLAAARERAIEAGIAAEMIDHVVAILLAAKAGGYEWVTSPFLLDLVLRKPQAM